MSERVREGPCRLVFALLAVVLMLLSGASSALASSAPEPPPVPSQGGTLRTAFQDDIKALNPFAASDIWSQNVIYNVYDKLLNRDWKTQKDQPWVVVGWGLDANQPVGCDTCNITVEYKLGDWEGKWGGPIFFHDGVKATLDDVLFSYGMSLYNSKWISNVDSIIWDYDWTNPPYGDSNFMKVTVMGKQGWLGVKKVNEHTLQFRLSRPYADFFEDTMDINLFPKHIWSNHINVQDGSGDYMVWDMGYDPGTGTAPGLVGTGPFVFGKWVQGQYTSEMKFENVYGRSYFDWTALPRVDDYGKRLDPEQPAYDPSWTKCHPTPYIDGIEFKIYKTTEAAALALTSEPPEVDFIAWPIPPSMISDMQKNPNVKLFYTSEPGFAYQAFNMRRITFGYKDYQNQDYTDAGKPLRKAVAYSTDKGAIVTQLLQGYGKAALGPVSPDNKIWHNDSLPAYGVNEAQAKKLLDDAGWTDTNGDGWRELPEIGGGQISMIVPEASYDPIQAVAGQIIATQAQKVGINLRSVPMAFGEIVSRLDRRDFQMYMLKWRIGTSDPGYLYNFFHCSQANGMNYPGYCNAKYDKLLDDYRETFDKPKRIQFIKDAQGILVDDLPYNTLYYRTNVEATRKDMFTGWVQDVSGVYTDWSLLLVNGPSAPMLTSFVGNNNKIISGGSMDVSVRVTDKATGSAIGDADMTLRIESGTDAARLEVTAGYPGTTDGITIIGKTDPSGYFKAKFNATAGLSLDRLVTLIALASKSGYGQENTAKFQVTVLKVGTVSIVIDQFTVDPDTIMAGDMAQVTVRVVDGWGMPVSGAIVTFQTTLGSVIPYNATSGSDGKATATFTVSKDTSIQGEAKVDIIAIASATIGGTHVISSPMTKVVIVTQYKEPPNAPKIFITQFDVNPLKIRPGGRGSIRLCVVDKNATPVAGATVSFSIQPSVITPPQGAITGADCFATSFLAVPNDLPGNVSSLKLLASASVIISGKKVDASAMANVEIDRSPTPGPLSIGTSTMLLASLIVIVVVTVIVIVILWLKVKKRKGSFGPPR